MAPKRNSIIKRYVLVGGKFVTVVAGFEVSFAPVSLSVTHDFGDLKHPFPLNRQAGEKPLEIRQTVFLCNDTQ